MGDILVNGCAYKWTDFSGSWPETSRSSAYCTHTRAGVGIHIGEERKDQIGKDGKAIEGCQKVVKYWPFDSTGPRARCAQRAQ